MKRLLVALTLWVAVVLVARPHAATVWTVKPSGGNYTSVLTAINDSTNVQPGDTVDVFTGSYACGTVTRSGSAGLPITVQAHTGETVTLTSKCTVKNQSYLYFGPNLHWTSAGIDGHDGTPVTTSNISVVGNFINCSSTGNVVGIYLYGSNNLIDGNDITSCDGDIMDLGGSFNVIRNNHGHDVDGAISAQHIDFIQLQGGITTGNGDPVLAFSLVENNTYINCTNSGINCHLVILRTCSAGTNCTFLADTVLARYNYAQNIDGTGVEYGGVLDSVPNGRVYNNTFAEFTDQTDNGSAGSTQATGTGNASNVVFKNNIAYHAQGNGFAPFAAFNNATATYGGNLAFNPGFAGSWNAPYASEATYAALHNQNPLFANYPTDDTLQVSSPAIGAGVNLTVVDVTDTGSGSSLIVSDARYFQPGWAGIAGDRIRIGATTTAQIASINYATNTLTLTSSPTRSNGDAVNLLTLTNGTTVLNATLPDVGAFPFSSAPPPVNGSNGSRARIGRRGHQ